MVVRKNEPERALQVTFGSKSNTLETSDLCRPVEL